MYRSERDFVSDALADFTHISHRLEHAVGIHPIDLIGHHMVVIYLLVATQTRGRRSARAHCDESLGDIPGLDIIDKYQPQQLLEIGGNLKAQVKHPETHIHTSATVE